MPIKQSPPQNPRERRAEDARVRADDAVPGVLGRGAALRPPEPPRERQQRLLGLAGPAEEGQLPSGDRQPAAATCSVACPVKRCSGCMSARSLGAQCAQLRGCLCSISLCHNVTILTLPNSPAYHHHSISSK